MFLLKKKSCTCLNHCICGLDANNDWKIVKLVGLATYAQLLDSGPGVFKPFCDYRSNGNNSFPVTSIFGSFKNSENEAVYNDINEHKIPTPPNLVSTILVENGITIYELKKLLLVAYDTNEIHPIIEPLIKSSNSYDVSVMSIGSIVILFIIAVLIISVLVSYSIASKKLI